MGWVKLYLVQEISAPQLSTFNFCVCWAMVYNESNFVIFMYKSLVEFFYKHWWQFSCSTCCYHSCDSRFAMLPARAFLSFAILYNLQCFLAVSSFCACYCNYHFAETMTQQTGFYKHRVKKCNKALA